MNLRAIASAIILTLPMSTTFADNSEKLICKKISATIPQLVSDAGTCTIKTYSDYFPDQTFLTDDEAQGITGYYHSPCFSVAQFTAYIDGIATNATAFSGLTEQSTATGGLSPFTGVLTAVTVIIFKDTTKGQKLGELVTQDVIFTRTVDNITSTFEHLVQIDGTRLFRGGKGNITITGNALAAPDAKLNGTLCADD